MKVFTMLNPNIANNATIREIGTLHGVSWGATFHGHINFDEGHEHDILLWKRFKK
jgi:hypothetical protein